MPNALQLNCGFFTAGAAGTGVATPMAGDTFNVANFSLTSNARVEQAWASGANTDFVRIRSPKMHDNNQGIRLQMSGDQLFPLLPYGLDQPLYPSDTPTVEIDETAAGTGGIAALYSYDDMPGVEPRLDSWAAVQPRIRNISGVAVTIGAIGAIGQYSAGAAINSLFDNFQANADYALLGYTMPAARLALAISGQDTGNLKVGGPGLDDSRDTSWWFVNLSNQTQRAYIPIIAANNKASTFVFQTDSAASAAITVSLIMAELQ